MAEIRRLRMTVLGMMGVILVAALVLRGVPGAGQEVWEREVPLARGTAPGPDGEIRRPHGPRTPRMCARTFAVGRPVSTNCGEESPGFRHGEESPPLNDDKSKRLWNPELYSGTLRRSEPALGKVEAPLEG